MNAFTSPFPYTLRDGRVVIDEWCSCLHLRSEHMGQMPIFGHGPCTIGFCECPKYTFEMVTTKATSSLPKFESSIEFLKIKKDLRGRLKQVEKLYDQSIREKDAEFSSGLKKSARISALEQEVAELRAFIEKVTLRYDSVKLRGRSILVQKEKKNEQGARQGKAERPPQTPV